jgi:hypothetical protein
MADIDRKLWQEIQKVLDVPEPKRTQLPFELEDIDGLGVYIVDGDAVKVEPRRGKSNRTEESDHMDFVEGGNDIEDPDLYRAVFHKPKTIKKTCLYLDDNIKKHDRPFICYHEICELRLMKKGRSYASAHDEANREEKQLRIEARGSCDTCKRQPCVCKKEK